MRVVLFALLAVGALHALPLEHANTHVEASGDEGSGFVEGSGVLATCPPATDLTETEEAVIAFRSHSNERSSEVKRDSKQSSEETTTARIVREDSKSNEDSSAEGYHRLKRSVEATLEAANTLIKETIKKTEENAEGLVTALRNMAESTTTDATVEEEGSGVETTTGAPKCQLLADCLDDSDCNGGRCLGAFLGTCNCGSCMSFMRCTTDAECGGFNKACNSTSGMCDCYGAYVLNGYKDTFDALSNLCNVKACGRDTSADDCFGLECNRGRCIC